MKFITFSATRTALFFTIFTILLLESVITHGSMYGEDDDYLGNIVDSFLNDDNVNFTSNVIHDNVSYLMKLEYTEGAGFENFNNYDEVDSDNDITVNENIVEWNTMRRDAESWVVFDFGVDYFNDFQINFTLDFSDIEAGDSSSRDILGICMLSNGIGSFADNVGGDVLVIFPRQSGGTDDRYKYVLKQITGGILDFDVVDATVYIMPKHYCTLERIGTTLTLRIYTDESRNTLVDTLTQVGNAKKYRYFYVIASYDSPTGDPADHSTGIVANVSLGDISGSYGNGYFLLNDILEGYRVIAVMYNATIPIDTSMTMEFFNGVEYVDHNNALGFESLSDGFEAIDLRDLNISVLPPRVNMTGSAINTPFFSQIRYVTIVGTVENGNGDGGIDNTPSIIMAIFLILVAISLIYGVRGRR